jgi:hypothetical protein
MSRINELEPSSPPPTVLERLIALLWTPREISIRPAFGLAAAAIAFLALAVPYAGNPAAENPTVAGGADPQVFVQFRLETAASRVQLAGTFTEWQPRYELRQSAPGVWTITVPLTQGVHDYAFVVDGRQWVPDPHAPQIGDGFGGTNSRLALLSPEHPQL